MSQAQHGAMFFIIFHKEKQPAFTDLPFEDTHAISRVAVSQSALCIRQLTHVLKSIATDCESPCWMYV